MHATTTSLESVLATDQLRRRRPRRTNYAAENRAMVALAQAMARSPEGILQKLVDTALDLCQAHSAGVSLLDDDGQRFRWPAIAGQWRFRSDAGTARDFGLCATVIDCNSAQLFTQPGRYFEHLHDVSPGIEEALLLPFHVEGRAVGTLWIVAHDRGRHFDAEDLRIMTHLGEFAAAIYTLKEADRKKDEFLATLAHELRNPLAPIRNSLQILRMTGGAAPVHRMMERQVAHMVHLVDDLLELSRISHGRIALRTERVDLETVLRHAIESSRPFIENKGHLLTVALPGEPVFLEGDVIRLAQIFSNLLNNAAKFTDRGGQISISARLNDNDAEISVRDTGRGIPAEMLPRIFDMFTQEGALRQSQDGLGIGLSLVRTLVAMHGGSVQALSEGVGCGSEFLVRLPVVAHGFAPAAPARIDESEFPRLVGKLLVVDDNRDCADSLGILLRMLGAEVQVVHSGPAALEALSDSSTVVLMDIGMPGMSGYEAARRIRANTRHKDTVLIALTGWSQPEDRLRCLEAGFDHYLVKPVDFDELQSLLSRVMPH